VVNYFIRFGIKKTDYHRYQADYVKLYVDNIRAIVMTEDTSRPFVTSSPSNGVKTATEGWIAKDPQSPIFGDSKCLYSSYSHQVLYYQYTGAIMKILFARLMLV